MEYNPQSFVVFQGLVFPRQHTFYRTICSNVTYLQSCDLETKVSGLDSTRKKICTCTYVLVYIPFVNWTVFTQMCKLQFTFITGNTARSAKRWYLSYSEADFEFFSPRRGDTLHRLGSNLARRREPKVPSSVPNFTPSAQRLGYRTLKSQNFYCDFIQIWNINASQGRIPCAIFTKFAEFEQRFTSR